MKLTYNQQVALDYLKKEGGETSVASENICFDGRAMKALVKKGLVKVEERSRLRQDDMEMVYWSVYKLIPTELEKALS